MATPRLFVSHSHEDDAFCQRLVTDLRAGLSDEDAVWYDTSGRLHGGDAWRDQIIAEIVEWHREQPKMPAVERMCTWR